MRQWQEIPRLLLRQTAPRCGLTYREGWADSADIRELMETCSPPGDNPVGDSWQDSSGETCGVSFSLSLAFSLMSVYSANMKVTEEALKSDPRVDRLLKNPNWKPAAEAAIAYLLKGTECPIASWRKSSTWAQVEMVAKELNNKSRW
jgi:hypothetical protein